MQYAQLTDFDELILRTRDPISRLHISEAINAYRGGAYRAAITSTWIAVSYDIISKIKELASKDDKNAQAFVQTLQTAVENNNIPQLQKIEDGLLDKAFNDFEFLATHEYEDLKRLKKDRNFCAHPAFVAEGVLFQPSPELVRAHIFHSVNHLLRHQPVQGKSAIKRLFDDLNRTSFPMDIEDAYTFLYDKYLKRAKDAFVRNLITALLKDFLSSNGSDEIRGKLSYLKVLSAVSRSHAVIYEQQMSSKLPTIVETGRDIHLLLLFHLIGIDDRCWNWLTEATQLQLKQLLSYVMSKHVANDFLIDYPVFNAILVPELNQLFFRLFEQLNSYQKEVIIAAHPAEEFSDSAIDLYTSAGSFRDAERLGSNLLLPMSSFLTADQVKKVLDGVRDNDQITYAHGSPDILIEFFYRTTKKFNSVYSSWQSLISELDDTDPVALKLKKRIVQQEID